MPPASHLRWAEIRDFSPGLWTVGEWLMPANAAQTMNDCYPQPGGGLRAWFKPTDFSVSGLETTTTKVIGLALHTGIDHRSLGADANDYYLVSSNRSTGVVKWWRKDETNENPVGSGSWSAIKTWAAGATSPHEAQHIPFILSDGTRHMCVSLFCAGSDDGLWSAKYSDGVVTSRLVAGAGPLTQHQARLVVAGAASTASKIYFSDAGSFTFGASSYIDIEPAKQGTENVLLLPFAPADLYVGKSAAGFHMVQGDLTDPIVRSMTQHQYLGERQTPMQTPAGITFIEPDNGVWATTMGNEFSRLDVQLGADGGPSDAADYGVALGQLAYMHHWLVAPRGFVFDFRTKSWFRTSPLASSFVQTVDTFNNALLAATYASGSDAFALKQYTMTEGEGTRYNTYTWKSAPLRDPNGRQLEIREVQVFCKVNDSSAQVAVTVNGTTRTITGLAAGKHQLSFLFSERAEVLDVQVVPSAGSSSNEAPSIECVRIGSRGHHLLSHG